MLGLTLLGFLLLGMGFFVCYVLGWIVGRAYGREEEREFDGLPLSERFRLDRYDKG
jgi:hypothetical protein